MEGIRFANPEFFYLFILLLPFIAWYVFKQNDIQATMQVSSTHGFIKAGKTYKHYLRHSLFVFRIFALSLIIVALARPQSTNRWENITTEGIDIVLAIDISSSMLAEDFEPNRIEAAKDVAIQFVSGRRYDRIGLVAFSAESFTQCPLTTDHAVLINLTKQLKSGIIEDGTAIGLGLANAIGRIKDSEAISKVIILLTDGVNNQGSIAPITAAELAMSFGIRVYTVGVGTQGSAPYPFKTAFGIQYQNIPVEIDEDILKEIARLTDGKYFRAVNKKKLVEIYNEIDKLEKSKIEVKEFSNKQEEYLLLAIFAGIFLLLEIFLRITILRNIP